jgi:hypothetical protein
VQVVRAGSSSAVASYSLRPCLCLPNWKQNAIMDQLAERDLDGKEFEVMHH